MKKQDIKNILIIFTVIAISSLLALLTSYLLYQKKIRKQIYIVNIEKIIKSGCSLYDIKMELNKINGIVIDSSVIIYSKDGIEITNSLIKRMKCDQTKEEEQ